MVLLLLLQYLKAKVGSIHTGVFYAVFQLRLIIYFCLPETQQLTA